MAFGEIHIKNETRPCYYEGERAIFHRWGERREMLMESPLVGGHPAGIIAATFAIIELEDGTVKEVFPSKIRFADGGGFKDVAFLEDNA